MKITNIHELSEPTVNAIKNDPYAKGDCDYSVTELLSPPGQKALQKKYHKRITEDATDKIWSLFGQCVHEILQRGATESHLCEKRFYVDIDGTRIGGQIDLFDTKTNTLTDYKVTSTGAFKHGKEEWAQQLNMLYFLMVANDFDVAALQIQAIWRDWALTKMQTRSPDIYPAAPATMIDCHVWPIQETLMFIRERIKLHKTSQTCPDHQTWYTGDIYAVIKKGRKTALRLLQTQDDALSWCLLNEYASLIGSPDGENNIILKKGISIQYRKGFHRRCRYYCNVRQWCKQPKKEY